MGQFSATALETYLKCPQQYVYKYHEKLWPHRPDDPVLQGQLFHQLMEQLVQKCFSQHTSLAALDVKEACQAFLTQDLIQKKIISAGADPFEHQIALQELLESQIGIESVWSQITHAVPAITELKGTLSVRGIPEAFDVRIDRVDRTDQGFWFIDYKTQSTPPSWAGLHRFEYLQPWLYTLYGLQQYQNNFLGFVYFLPKLKIIRPVIIFHEENNHLMSDWIPQKSKLLSPSAVQEKTQELAQFVHELIQKIQRQEFSVPTPPTRACRMCAYRTFCKVLHTP